MKLLKGKDAANAIKAELKKKVEQNKSQGRRSPHLAAILVGNDGASETYVANKVKTCSEIGFQSTLLRRDDTISEEDLLAEIVSLNNNKNVDGILVQLPLPKHINEHKVIAAISPDKDVDGFHPISAGKLVQGLDSFIAATPLGIMLLLKHYNIETRGKNVVVIGRSNIVGRPISILLNGTGDATVTVCHRHTPDVRPFTKEADIVVAAVGIPGFLKADMIKEGAVIIDVGITRVEDASKEKGYMIKGDADFDALSEKVSAITPVPGGVGVMTIAALMQNTMKAYTHNVEL